MTFNSLNLIPELIAAVESVGYKDPTPIQAQAIPLILTGCDLLAGAQTGTGKTASFTIPLLQNLAKNRSVSPRLRALILTPTRELASQVEESVRTYGKNLPLKSGVIFGGVNINQQIHLLQKGVDILVATPGRLLDLLSQKALNLSCVEILVLDEADRMLDMGFIHDVKKILALLPKKRQSLLFSATFSPEIKELASKFLVNPQFIQVASANSTASGVTQLIHPVDTAKKSQLLSFLVRSKNLQQVLVFTRTKRGANLLSAKLIGDGISSAAIHGNKSQGARTKALDDFKKGHVRVLCATDIAARGIDIDQLPNVINFDLPNVPADYVHRIGRTGRAGSSGSAISLVSIDENALLVDIEKLLRKKITQQIVPGFEPNPTPIIKGRRS